MRRSHRIQRLAKLQKLVENKAIAEMRRARHKLDGARALHEHLTVHGAHYEQQVENRARASTAGLYHRYRSFVARLYDAIRQQEQQISLEQQQVGRSEAFWRQQRAESLAAEAFLDKVMKAEMRQLEEREKRSDEDLHATRRHVAGAP